MHRQIYPVLITCGVLVATAVCLRPQLTEELLAIAQAETGYDNPLRESAGSSPPLDALDTNPARGPGAYGSPSMGYPNNPRGPDRSFSPIQPAPAYFDRSASNTRYGSTGGRRYGPPQGNAYPAPGGGPAADIPASFRSQTQSTPGRPFPSRYGGSSTYYGSPSRTYQPPVATAPNSPMAQPADFGHSMPSVPSPEPRSPGAAPSGLPEPAQAGSGDLPAGGPNGPQPSAWSRDAQQEPVDTTADLTGPEAARWNPTPPAYGRAAPEFSGSRPAAPGFSDVGPSGTGPARFPHRPTPPPSATSDAAPPYRSSAAPTNPYSQGQSRLADRRRQGELPSGVAVPSRSQNPAGFQGDRAPGREPSRYANRAPEVDPPAGPSQQPDRGRQPAGQAKPCTGAQILARVGSDVILASEVLPLVNEALRQNKDRVPEHQLEALRRKLVQQRLVSLIQTKLIYQDAVRSIPEEGLPHIQEQLSEEFEKTELPKMMERAGASSRQDLEQKLRSLGTSIQREKKSFSERILAAQWMQEQIDRDQEITHAQMLAYYEEHLSEFETPARARWQELAVRFSEYPSRAAAREALARMGNQVIDGASFAEVAKAQSDGPTAESGGQRDWTNKGSLRNKDIDRAIFSLPVGKLSPIIEDDRGLHIVRVVEREEARRKPFVEAQVEIKEKIRQERIRKQHEAYTEKLRKQIPVWTIFEDPDAEIALGE